MMIKPNTFCRATGALMLPKKPKCSITALVVNWPNKTNTTIWPVPSNVTNQAEPKTYTAPKRPPSQIHQARGPCCVAALIAVKGTRFPKHSNQSRAAPEAKE